MKDDSVYLRHILESIGRVREFTRGVSEERFLKDALVQSAVIRQLEIIGEAVKNLSPSFRKRHKNVPWKDISGLWDKLIHGYFGVDISLVWGICEKDLPELKGSIRSFLGER